MAGKQSPKDGTKKGPGKAATQFKKGHTGRPKGIPNKATREVKAFCQEFLTSPEYVESAKQRVLAGEANHLETLWHHYAFGKPKDRVEIKDVSDRPAGDDALRAAATALLARLNDAADVAAAE